MLSNEIDQIVSSIFMFLLTSTNEQNAIPCNNLFYKL